MANISIKSVYEAIAADDGVRILVDRLWPRGLKKEKAGVDLWLKNIAPSHELRKWFRHEAQKFGISTKIFAGTQGRSCKIAISR